MLSLLILGGREALLGRTVRRLAPPVTASMHSVAGLVQEKSDVT